MNRTFSVVIPTYNRKDKLKATLDCLMAQKYPEECLEIVVVDDGSKDATETMMAEMVSRHKNIIYIKKSHVGHAAALNVGMRKGTGEILFNLMDDIFVEPTYIGEYNSAFTRHPDADFVGGYVIPYSIKERPNIYARYEWFVTQYYYRFKIEEKFINSGETVGPCPSCFKREVFERAGGYTESISGAGAEDVEFLERVRKNGYKTLNIVTPTYHNQDYTLTGFIRLSENRGRGGRQYLEVKGSKTARLRFAVKFLATPVLFFKYWAEFAGYGQWKQVDMVILHTLHNSIASLYAAFAR